MFLDNTACNLASANLMKFFDTSKNIFDVEGFAYTCRLWTTVLEISVLMAQFPSKEERFLLNWQKGSTQQVGCWINESVVLNTRD